ncbi:delta-latroinsectotoxin-Lt1a-like [Parasteatoda tepidariorum]|uniref:delta-latroinsectotoxin-Lt1a-like n=1 Tax=Parasteatoda tepidariorum TaxID=114398 RepID=UPI001C71E1EF|nr:delta-latroinsectotoxin-Lt1a-like [Parasteatoda tepidariorum]
MRIDTTSLASAVAKRDTDDDADVNADYEKSLEEIETRKKICKGFEYAEHTTGLVGNLIDDLPDLPLITDTVKVVLSGITAILHIAEFGMDIAQTAMRCGAVNFDEVKVIMNKRFDDVDKKLDKMTEVMEKLDEAITITLRSVEKTRAEMNWGFKTILASLKNHEIQTILSKINKFSRYFEEKKDEISKLPKDQFVFRLKEEDGILDYLQKIRKPEGLHSDLLELMDKNTNYAIPKNAEDIKAFQALYALFYGTQTYASVMFFLLKQHSYLASYFYQEGKDADFNDEFDILIATFKEFKTSLIGSKGLINKVVQTLDEVKNKPFILFVEDQLYADISKRQDSLRELQSNIANMTLYVIEDVPDPVLDIDFDEPIIPSNYGDWDDKARVKYAVQLRKNGTYSKFSDWTESVKVDGKANPFLKINRDEYGRDRLVFRKFNDEKPQLAGILTKSQMEFRDIDRDLYNAAKSKNQNISLEYIPKLIEEGAYIRQVFEMNRSVMHAAAESGNVKIAFHYLLDVPDNLLVNAVDDKGYTPMHVAADTKNAGFINFLATHSADVNAQTTSEKLTPLHLAARKGYSIAVNYLLSSDKIEINKPEKSGYTPLHYAVRGTPKTIQTLLAKDQISVNARSDFGLTPFHLAVMKGNREICDALLSSGKVEVNAGDKNNMTPLHFAAMEGNINMIQYLLSGKKEVEGVEVNAVTSDTNWTPLYAAIYFQQEDAALELLKNEKVDISLTSKEKNTPLQLSIANGQMKVFDELLKKTSDLGSTTEKGLTALHVAALRPEADFIAKLLDRNANIDAKALDGNTPLHLAAISDKMDPIILLINKGASLKLFNNENLLPPYYFVKNMNFEAMNAMVKQDPNILHFNTTEGIAVGQYCLDFVFFRIFDFYKNKDSFEYRKYKNLPPLEAFHKLGYYNLLRTLSYDEKLINGTIEMANDAVIMCLEIEKNPDKKQCSFTFPNFHQKRDINNVYSKLQLAQSSTGPVQNVMSPNLLGSKLADPRKSFSNAKTSMVQNVDTNGMLLWLDLIVRKVTNEKYNMKLNAPMSALESQAEALKIVEKVSEFIDSVSDVPAEELIDLAKLHSDVYKSIEGGKSDIILSLLCDQLRSIVDPESMEDFFSALISDASQNQDFINNVKQRCLSEANKE